MGSPCELLLEKGAATLMTGLATLVANEAWRIEDKFSRYLKGNIVDRINSATGEPVGVDDETAQIIEFANTLHALSDGLFDISSGVLRSIWTFDGGSDVPDTESVNLVLARIGWDKAIWQSPVLTIQSGMEIDLGGIGKEYAIDRAILLLREATTSACLVNFGGDLAVTGPPASGRPWKVGIETGDSADSSTLLELREGALATSGDARRFVDKDGIRFGHILNPKTGWPVDDAACSITVAADTCVQAGMLSTLAMLKGAGAEEFLEAQSEQYWCRR
jgi:thiamine biosynthesis lipoprotein